MRDSNDLDRNIWAERRYFGNDPAYSPRSVGIGIIQGDGLISKDQAVTHMDRSKNSRWTDLQHPFDPGDRKIICSLISGHIKDYIVRLVGVKHDLIHMIGKKIIICKSDVGCDEVEYSPSSLT